MAGALALFLASSLISAETAGAYWPQWRGPRRNGLAPDGDPPVSWSETTNLHWKVALPGFGTSTPIIWGDHVFIVSALVSGSAAPAAPAPSAAAPASAGQRPRRGGGSGGGGGGFGIEQPRTTYRFLVLAYECDTGKLLWQQTACEEVPHEGHHRDHGFASASPVTDGERVYAWFGSRGLYCYDFAGRLQWQKRFGRMETRNSFGEGSSPALHGDTLVILWDHEGEDFIAALDKRTGKELWRQSRDEPTGWTTPLVVTHEGRTEVVVSGTTRIRSYELASGRPLWECAGMTANAIPSAVAGPGLAYFISGFRGSALLAIKLGRSGDLSDSDAIAWRHHRNTPYVPSPLLYDGLLYFFSGNNAALSCFDARTGQPHYEAQRLEGIYGMYASPVGVAGRVYLAGRDGQCAVLKHGPKLEVLSRPVLEDKFDASPAVAGRQLFLRGHRNLYCLANTAEESGGR
jgi:outer membrane protein assembly factor BamB